MKITIVSLLIACFVASTSALNVTWYTNCVDDADLEALANTMSDAFRALENKRFLRAAYENDEPQSLNVEAAAAEEEEQGERFLGVCDGGNLYTCQSRHPMPQWYMYCAGCPCFFGGPGCRRRLAGFSPDRLNLVQSTLQAKGRAARACAQDTVVLVEND
jgi:hypothetical protein